jgi:acyl-CoA reductase-like NAD-dependent aldehyde dehydrogenase
MAVTHVQRVASGGYNESGFGREGGLQGLAAYCRVG